jgi:hypothetical protein
MEALSSQDDRGLEDHRRLLRGLTLQGRAINPIYGLHRKSTPSEPYPTRGSWRDKNGWLRGKYR